MTSSIEKGFAAVGIKLLAHYIVAGGEICDILPMIANITPRYCNEDIEVATLVREKF